jgi:glutamate-1-semialdehyde 2,1-aminomutase
MIKFNKSEKAYKKACRSIPGGVNSPVRAFGGVGGTPVFISSGRGAYITDIDGNRYMDFVSSWGPLILGHAHPAVVSAIKKAAERGTTFGAPTELETEMAEQICKRIPSMEMVRLVNSGTEATMSAIRLARGFTGRDLIVKFVGCYHGHGDSFLIAAGSGAATLGIPNSPGVTAGTAKGTLIAVYNDTTSVDKLFHEFGNKIAALIVEPVAGNMGVVPPKPGFLEHLRSITKKNGSLLVFDEVITGFRLGNGGAQEYYGLKPDLTTLGKIIGGGLPVGAFGGKKEIMKELAPLGAVYQAGTLSGNPLAMAAGIAMLKEIERDKNFYKKLDQKAEYLADGMRQNCADTCVPCVLNRVGSMMTAFFTPASKVVDYDSAKTSDTKFYAKFFHACLNRGMYVAPSQFEAMFVSAAHSNKDIDQALRIHKEVLEALS